MNTDQDRKPAWMLNQMPGMIFQMTLNLIPVFALDLSVPIREIRGFRCLVPTTTHSTKL
jgi:hypothetical protein